MLATEHLCWPSDIYCGHWIDGQILADGGTLGKRKSWDSGKFGWSRFDQNVVGVRRWKVRCGLPTIREFATIQSTHVTLPNCSGNSEVLRLNNLACGSLPRGVINLQSTLARGFVLPNGAPNPLRPPVS